MVKKSVVKAILRKYAQAWIKRDPDMILEIFTKNAIYHERVLEKPHIGHKQIRRYWQSKVVGEQKNIKFRLLNVYIDGDTAIAEWEAQFFNKKRKRNVHMQEIAVLKIKNNKISSLREYWHSKSK